MEGEISGVPFTIRWCFAEKLNTIKYLAEYPDDMDTAVKDALKVANAIGNTIRKKTIRDEVGIFDVTETELREIVEGKRFTTATIYWDLSEVADDAIKDYINEMKNTEFWKAAYGKIEPTYYLMMTLSRVEDTVYVWLDLGIEHDPNGSKH